MAVSKHMQYAIDAAKLSGDPHTQVGCIIVRKSAPEIVSGANRFPRGVKMLPERMERPEKYTWIEHAERDLIAMCAREGIITYGAEMYLPWFPCPECARVIVNAGIFKLHCFIPDAATLADPKWNFQAAMDILHEGQVVIVGETKE